MFSNQPPGQQAQGQGHPQQRSHYRAPVAQSLKSAQGHQRPGHGGEQAIGLQTPQGEPANDHTVSRGNVNTTVPHHQTFPHLASSSQQQQTPSENSYQGQSRWTQTRNFPPPTVETQLPRNTNPIPNSDFNSNSNPDHNYNPVQHPRADHGQSVDPPPGYASVHPSTYASDPRSNAAQFRHHPDHQQQQPLHAHPHSFGYGQQDHPAYALYPELMSVTKKEKGGGEEGKAKPPKALPVSHPPFPSLVPAIL